MNLKELERRKSFFEFWYNRCPEICQIQLDYIDKRILKINKINEPQNFLQEWDKKQEEVKEG